MKQTLNILIITILLCLFTACASTEKVSSSISVEPTVTKEEAVPSDQIIFNGDSGNFHLILSKIDMSAKLYYYGEQIKEGYWTSASASVGANLLIFIDEKPADLFLNVTDNEYRISVSWNGVSDTLRCPFNSWYSKLRNFTSLKESDGEILFYGASNFAYWTTMQSDLSPFLVHNHSVGGLSDKQLLASADKLLYPYNPSIIVLQPSSNDYNGFNNFTDEEAIIQSLMAIKIEMYEEYHKNLPNAKIVLLSGFPTVKKAELTSIILKVNERIKAYCNENSDWMMYVETATLTYDTETGEYREDYFLEDKHHLTPQAKKILASNYLLPALESLNAVKGYSVNESETLNLYPSTDSIPFYEEGADSPYLKSYIVNSDTPTKAIIIFHGGGFVSRSVPKEGEDIASYFTSVCGYSCFVCYYRINTDYRGIISDSIRAVKYIRANAKKFNIDPNEICLMGFSAGGSLSLLESEHYNDEEYLFGDELDLVNGRPDYLCLLYPGSSFMSQTKNRFFRSFLSDDLLAHYNPELNITNDMPEIFIAHAQNDTTAPIEQTYSLYNALKEKGVNVEFTAFSSGGHGFALGNNAENVQWRYLFQKWFDER